MYYLIYVEQIHDCPRWDESLSIRYWLTDAGKWSSNRTDAKRFATYARAKAIGQGKVILVQG